MTWAEQLEQRGREEEREKARLERERLLTKMRQHLLQMLELKFGPLPSETVRTVEHATEEMLDRLAAAATLEELLGLT